MGKRNSEIRAAYIKFPNNFKVSECAFEIRDFRDNCETGLVGMFNMGNTCFINTAVQCLSSVRPLTDYFLSNLHMVSLNKTNPFGSKGEIAESFGKLV